MRQLPATKKENDDLEKPVNKLNNTSMFRRSILFFTVLLLTAVNAFAQSGRVDPKRYILGGITVTGKTTYNPQTIVHFTKLEKGQSINVPGEEISAAIKSLWKLGLFQDVVFYENHTSGDTIFLDLEVNELPKLNAARIQGVKKSKQETLIKEADLTKGKYVNENLITNTKYYIENKYKKDGYFNTKVAINVVQDTANTVNMVVNVDRGEKVRIHSITINGNEKMSDKKVRKAMKKTKVKAFPNPLRLFTPSKFIQDKYKEDLANIVKKYKEKGYRDARVTSDTVTFDAKRNMVDIVVNVEEGRKYYFGEIKYLGNSVYTNQELSSYVGIKKGDTYNGILLNERISDPNPDAESLANLYQNHGYLFSNINAVEVKTVNDTIDFEIRITEGPIAYYNKITVVGNDKTNDHVIYRQLMTRPGQKWNKEDVINTIRELGTLGFFDAETIRPDIKNPDPASGTVDVEWNVTERGSSQIELQGGYGGGGFIGTLGLSFNNFSLRNLFNKSAYDPLPMGDGQKLSLRAQGSTYFQTYSLSFTEPWMGGKKPIQFFTSFSFSKQFQYNYYSQDVDRSQSFTISSVTMGLSKRLNDPDYNMRLSHSLTFQYYNLSNYNYGLFTFSDGTSRNLAYTIELTRDNRGPSLIYPTYGALFSLSFRTTFPYSLINGVDYANLGNKPEYKYTDEYGNYLDEDGNHVSVEDADADPAKVDQERFKWLEYYKIKFKADWYTKIYDKLVLRSLAEFGFMGAYNQDRGLVPFERFYLGGDGMANYSLDGREMIQLRGYPNQSLSPINSLGQQLGGTIYNKYSMELRYPITLKQQASIYALTFAEAGSSFASFADYNPFKLQRSAGFGLRVFMPAFGLLGIDFGYGFDAVPNNNNITSPNGWETHFIIGQQF
jgi:outer membrane protein insertion porin family